MIIGVIKGGILVTRSLDYSSHGSHFRGASRIGPWFSLMLTLILTCISRDFVELGLIMSFNMAYAPAALDTSLDLRGPSIQILLHGLMDARQPSSAVAEQ